MVAFALLRLYLPIVLLANSLGQVRLMTQKGAVHWHYYAQVEV